MDARRTGFKVDRVGFVLLLPVFCLATGLAFAGSIPAEEQGQPPPSAQSAKRQSNLGESGTWSLLGSESQSRRTDFLATPRVGSTMSALALLTIIGLESSAPAAGSRHRLDLPALPSVVSTLALEVARARALSEDGARQSAGQTEFFFPELEEGLRPPPLTGSTLSFNPHNSAEADGLTAKGGKGGRGGRFDMLDALVSAIALALLLGFGQLLARRSRSRKQAPKKQRSSGAKLLRTLSSLRGKATGASRDGSRSSRGRSGSSRGRSGSSRGRSGSSRGRTGRR